MHRAHHHTHLIHPLIKHNVAACPPNRALILSLLEAGRKKQILHTLSTDAWQETGKTLPGCADRHSLVFCGTHSAQQCRLNTWHEPAQGRIRVRLGLLVYEVVQE